jgi:hypothetical protein
MSSLALAVSFILVFAIGISWLALTFDARIERSRLVRQIPLPLDAPSSTHRRRAQSGLRPVMAVTGCMLLLLSGTGAAILGRLATMQPAEAAAVFVAYPLLKSLWGQIMGVGPIACVVLAVPGTYCISVGLGNDKR